MPIFRVIISIRSSFSWGMYIRVNIDQLVKRGYFLIQIDHLHILKGVSNKIGTNTSSLNRATLYSSRHLDQSRHGRLSESQSTAQGKSSEHVLISRTSKISIRLLHYQVYQDHIFRCDFVLHKCQDSSILLFATKPYMKHSQ